MTDQIESESKIIGHIVCWNEVHEITGHKEEKHHYFNTKYGADNFAATLSVDLRPRVYARYSSNEQEDTVGRDDADVQNRKRLVELMAQHNITIPAKQFDKWRPTEEKSGRIEGVADGITCIMTDGMLGYFTREGKQPLYGHTQWFKWDVPNVSYVPYLDEHGEEKFFKQEIDSGAPPAYFKRPRKPGQIREKKERKPKAPRVPMTSAAALDLIKQMTMKLNGDGASK